MRTGTAPKSENASRAIDGVLRHVGHREGEIRCALLEELQVVDRCRRHLGGRFGVVEMLGDHLGDATAVGIEDAAGTASCDRETSLRPVAPELCELQAAHATVSTSAHAATDLSVSILHTILTS